MKKDRKQELKNKSVAELREMAHTMYEELSRLRFDLRAGKTDVIKEIHKTKKELAFVLTRIHNHDHEENK